MPKTVLELQQEAHELFHSYVISLLNEFVEKTRKYYQIDGDPYTNHFWNFGPPSGKALACWIIGGKKIVYLTIEIFTDEKGEPLFFGIRSPFCDKADHFTAIAWNCTKSLSLDELKQLLDSFELRFKNLPTTPVLIHPGWPA